MPIRVLHCHLHHTLFPPANSLTPAIRFPSNNAAAAAAVARTKNGASMLRTQRRRSSASAVSASLAPLDLTEENIKQVLADARIELAQLFDTSVNITGKAELAELDGPYVKISLSGRFWHTRSTVLARLGNYLKQRIPVRWKGMGSIYDLDNYGMVYSIIQLGLIPPETSLPWFKTGVIPPAETYNYWADNYTLFVFGMALRGFAEHQRFQDWANPGSMGKQYILGLENGLGGSGDSACPGGPFFNPLGLGKDEKSKKDLKLKEVKNGRLAMLAILGYFIQGLVTGVGPFENLLDHLSDPVHNNVLTSLKFH